MAKKAASLKNRLADGIKLILVLTSFASTALFLSALGFHRTDSHSGGKRRHTWDWEWAEKTADFFGTSPITLIVFSFIALAVSLGSAIFIHLKFSPDEELEDVFGTLPKKGTTVSPVFKFFAWFLGILILFGLGHTIWREVKALLL